MKSLIHKDKILREKYSNQELNQKILVYSFRNLLNSKSHSKRTKKSLFGLMFKKFKKITSKTKIVRRCVLTGRSKSSLRMFGISRIKIKELIRDNKISNGSKNSW